MRRGRGRERFCCGRCNADVSEHSRRRDESRPYDLERRSGLGEKREFLRCGFPSENLVAVREAAEARDDVAMANGEIEIFFERVRFVPLERSSANSPKAFTDCSLMLERFRVLQRQVKEYSFDRPELADQFAPRCRRGTTQELSSPAAKALGRIAIDVARELIGKKNQSQTPARRRLPIG